MLKKFFATLVGFREVSEGQKPFHQQEQIERELAEERRHVAMENERERLKDEMKKRQAPSEEEILGPSDSDQA